MVGVLLAKKLDSSFFDKRGGGTNGVTSFQDSLLGPQTTANEAFIAEVIGTFFLLTVVYATVDPQRSNNTLHISALGPLAIGMAITVVTFSSSRSTAVPSTPRDPSAPRSSRTPGATTGCSGGALLPGRYSPPS